MGLSRMVVASRRQDGSLSPLTLSVSLRTLTLCLAYGFLFFFFSIRFSVWFWTIGLVGLLFFLFLTFTWALGWLTQWDGLGFLEGGLG